MILVMKKNLIALPAAAALFAALLTGCDSSPSTCAPQAMGQIALQSIESPLPLKPGGGSGGGGGRGGSGGSGGSKGGSKSGGGSHGGSKNGGSSGGSSGGGSKPAQPRTPSTGKPDRGYKPTTRPGQPAPTYVRQPDGSWMPFIGGLLVGEALSDPPAGCR